MSHAFKFVSLIALTSSFAFGAGCNIETHDGYEDDECSSGGSSFRGAAVGGSGNTAQGGSANGGSASGGSSTGGTSTGSDPAPDPCESESDCAPGFNCAADVGLCLATDAETCGELAEEACGMRADCEVIYAGVDCSCGAGCECQGGEPGCVCDSFEFFRCETLEVP